MKNLTPFIIFILAGLAYFTVISPLYNGGSGFLADLIIPGEEQEGSKLGIKQLLASRREVNQALTTVGDLKQRQEELNQQYQAIDDKSRQRLEEFLPDSFENIDLYINLNRLARLNGMEMKDAKIDQAEQTPEEQYSDPTMAEGGAPAPSGNLQTVNFSFSVEGTYASLRSFLNLLSDNLRLIDVVGLSLAEGEKKGEYKYDFKIKTYWLN